MVMYPMQYITSDRRHCNFSVVEVINVSLEKGFTKSPDEMAPSGTELSLRPALGTALHCDFSIAEGIETQVCEGCYRNVDQGRVLCLVGMENACTTL